MDTVTIDLWCHDHAGERLAVFHTEEEIPENKKRDFILVRFFVKNLTWKMHNELIDQCTFTKKKGGIEHTDWLKYREVKLKKIIDGWNLTDDDGNDIPVNEENIMSLHPILAEELLREYDSISFLHKEAHKELVLKCFRYYQSSMSASGQVDAPREAVELSLMEKFSWTPEQIDLIPYKRLQEIFAVMNQREQTQQAAQQAAHIKQ